MFELLNPFLLGGLAAVSAPVIIHLLHRRHAKRVDWGAMRFLLELLAKRRKRLFFEELLLLLIRTCIIACIALVMVRPAFTRTGDLGPGGDITRLGRTASVLLLDDSISSSAGRAQPAFESMKRLSLAYVDSLAPGDEVSLRLMSRLGGPLDDPVFDLESLKTQLASLEPSYVSTDVPGIIEEGLEQLRRHVNPGAELVLVTDGRRDGWHEDDKARWDDLNKRLAGQKNSALGSRERPRLIVLSPDPAAIEDNVAITRVAMDRTLVSAGRLAGVRVAVANYGKQSSRSVTVQTSINGQIIGSKRVDVSAGGEAEAVFPHTFEQPGSYGIETSLVENQDLLAADDRRALSLQVESSVPVLLVDPDPAGGLQGKLGFLSYALDPEGQGNGAFKVKRIGTAQLSPAALDDCRVVALGDTRMLESGVIDALERFVVAGGGILVGLGPNTAPELVNRYWARDGEGFLPAPLGNVITPARPALPATVNLGHRVFSGFGTRTDEAWKNARVKSYFKLKALKDKAAETDALLTLDNGDPLLVERRRGLGLVCLVATSLNAEWTDLPLEAAYVPLMRGIVGDLGSFVMPPRNLQPGEQIIYARVKDRTRTMKALGPRSAVKVSLGAWEGRDAIVSEPLLEPGIYELRDQQEPNPIHYAVALGPAESSLKSIRKQDMKKALGGSGAFFASPEEVAAHLDPTRRRNVELWKWFLAAAVGLMFVEAWLPRRETT
jgi:hypothetical protein